MVAADDKAANPNDNSGADSKAFASDIWGGRNITDKEEAAPKEKSFADVFAPAEAITEGVFASDGSK